MLDTNIIAAKVETTYGTNSSPSYANNALVTYGWQPRPIIYDDVRRSIDRGFAGATPKIKARGRQSHSFRAELCGSGTADVPASWGSVWLRGCGFLAPAVSAGTEVGYPLVIADDGVGLSLLANKGGLRHRGEGLRGNAKFNWTAGALPYIDLDFMGLLNNMPDAAAVSGLVLPAYPAPLEVNSINTTFSLGGYAALLRSIEIDLGMKTEYRDLVGQRAIIFGKSDDGDRRAVKGSLTIELPDPSVKEYFSSIPARTALPMSIVHGPATNQVEFATTKLYLDEPSFSAEQNRVMMQASFELVPDAAGNEFALKTR